MHKFSKSIRKLKNIMEIRWERSYGWRSYYYRLKSCYEILCTWYGGGIERQIRQVAKGINSME